ncbi:MAG TPA: serine/threonine-protein kinase, partial [Chloroflexia bacterium]|nr:serine/threonine-protein kinase [Chloroflexia bacterium]
MPAKWIGETLDGRYQIERVLGSGATAMVYEAVDTQLQRGVAVKMLRPDAAQDPAIAASFQREAQLAAGLHHPHLAQVYDAGTAGAQPYIVMERVAGEPLSAHRRLPVALAVDIAAQVASALAFVHDQGLLHCDIKPANILVDSEQQIKLVDFAGAGAGMDPAALGDDNGGATLRLPLVHTSPGTLPYLAPERMAGAPPSARADVYSVGAVLYTLLAGRPPYDGTTGEAIYAARQGGPPPPLRELNPAVPPAAEAVVQRALAADPDARYASATELQAALEAVREGSSQPTSSFSEVAAAAGPVVPFLPVDVLPAPDPAPVAVAAATNIPTQAGDETSTWVPVGRPVTAPSSSAAFAPYRP